MADGPNDSHLSLTPPPPRDSAARSPDGVSRHRCHYFFSATCTRWRVCGNIADLGQRSHHFVFTHTAQFCSAKFQFRPEHFASLIQHPFERLSSPAQNVGRPTTRGPTKFLELITFESITAGALHGLTFEPGWGEELTLCNPMDPSPVSDFHNEIKVLNENHPPVRAVLCHSFVISANLFRKFRPVRVRGMPDPLIGCQITFDLRHRS